MGVGETDRGESTAKTTGDAAGEVVETPPLKKAAKTEGVSVGSSTARGGASRGRLDMWARSGRAPSSDALFHSRARASALEGIYFNTTRDDATARVNARA